MRDKGLATAVATLLAAFATAHLMQFGLSAGRAISGEEQASPIGIATLVAMRSDDAPDNLPATPSTAPDPIAIAFDLPDARLPPRDVAVPAALGAVGEGGFGLSCDRTLTLLTLPDALVEARLKAPCDPGVRVELSHAGLRFAIAIGADGRAATLVPALTPDAIVEAAFADGTILSARVAVPEAAEMERVALVADGWAGLTLRAAESVSWRGEATAAAVEGRGAEILHLGDPGTEAPLLTQVYTAPIGRFGSLGAARLQVEASLTPANCARDVGAEVIRSSGGVPPTPVALHLSLPACDAEGGLLVIDLSSPGLRMARN
jgi:hypothetical protein